MLMMKRAALAVVSIVLLTTFATAQDVGAGVQGQAAGQLRLAGAAGVVADGAVLAEQGPDVLPVRRVGGGGVRRHGTEHAEGDDGLERGTVHEGGGLSFSRRSQTGAGPAPVCDRRLNADRFNG